MNSNNPITRSQESVLENFAAELTDAACLVALRYGVVGSSVDLELKLWQALGDTVRSWKQGLPPCG